MDSKTFRSLTEPGKHADGEVPGLYLEVRASSKAGKAPSKSLHLKYRLHGKENRFSIGAYPDIGLKEARDIARGARRDVTNHTAPLKAKSAKIEAKRLNEVRTFEYVAKQWLAFKSAELVTKSIPGLSGALNNHILPAIGKKAVKAYGLLFSCPEYARGIPGAFKNMLDWLVIPGKPVVLFNASPRASHAQAALRLVLVRMTDW